MIGVVDQSFLEADLATGQLPCPVCAGVLRPWGHARTRRVRDLGQAMLTITPRRARCADCGTTQVLLPGLCLPRRADSTAVIATALAASATGTGYRRIAVALGPPLSTVRRWVRSVPPVHAARLRVGATRCLVRLDPDAIAALAPARTRLGDALAALAATASAARARVAPNAPPWALFARFADWQLLEGARAG